MNARRALVVLLLTALSLSIPGAASAEPDRIELSRDGKNWRTTLAAPLFQDVGKLVPRDDVVRSFYVRNASSVPTRASVKVLAPEVDSDLAKHLRVRTRIGRAQSAETVGEITTDGCTTTVTSPTMLPGEWKRIEVGLSLPDLQGSTAQNSSADLALVVRLTQVDPSGVVTICGVQAEAEPYDPCDPGMVAVAGGLQPCTEEVAAVEDAAAPTGGVQPMLPSTGAPPDATELALTGAVAMLLGAIVLLGRRRLSRHG